MRAGRQVHKLRSLRGTPFAAVIDDTDFPRQLAKQKGVHTMNRSSTGLTDRTEEIVSNTSQMLDRLIQQVRSNIGQVQEPKAQALFETTAEVLLGLKKAYQDYKSGDEKAWQ
jgi:hypothetical protein